MKSAYEEIKKNIHQFINNNFPTDEPPDDDSKVFEEGYIDSVGLLSLIHHLEDAFDVRLSDEDVIAENFESIAKMTAMIQTKMAGN